MKWTHSAKWILLTTLVIVASGLFALALRSIGERSKTEAVSKATQPRAFDKFRMTGAVFSSQDEQGRLVIRLKVGEFEHRKRRAGFITFNPIKEIVLRDVEVKFYSYDREASQPENSSSVRLSFEKVLKDIIPQDSGIVSRVVINEIKLAFFKEGAPTVEGSAQQASVNLRSKEVTLEGAFSLVSANGERLTAAKAGWRSEGNLFFIPGPYQFSSGQNEKRGTRGAFIIDQGGKILLSEATSGNRS
jgi:hypothetical protein